jgi:DNA-binding transcriptional LysR family regulator
MQDLNDMLYFAEVVDHGSFAAAGRALGLPKSRLSRRIADLEAALGVRLLQRTTRKLGLTEAGLAYFERARIALTGLEEAASAATQMSHEPRGTVRLSVPGDSGALNLAERVARFQRKYPLVHVDISFSSRHVDLVAEGFDLALRAGRLRDSSLVARKIGSDSLGLFAAPSYLRRRGKPKVLKDLAEHDCVLFRGVQGKCEWALNGPRGEESVTVRGPVNADEMSFVQQAVAVGLGIALLPCIAIRLAALQGTTPLPVRLLPEYSAGGAELNLVMPSARFQSASVLALRDFLHAEISEVWRSV